MSESNINKYYGKYRGTVINNVDPEFRARLMIMVPDVLGLVPSTWAEACAPLAGPTGPPMGVHMVPPIGAGVWVEFEQGNPDYPIWTGCRFGAPTDVPLQAKLGIPADPNIVIQSLLQHAIIISDSPPSPPPPALPPAVPPPGGITLRSATGASIVVSDVGIFISNGKGATIMMVGPTVTINNGALVVI